MTHAGIIKAILGNVSARTPDGQIRQLFVGDVIYENEIIETGAGSGVSIELNDGRTLDLSENSQFAINGIVATTVDSHNAFVTEVEELQAALEAGEEIPEEETEAGEEDDGYIYDLAYHAGHQFGGKVYSYLFGPGYGEEDEGQDYNTAYIFEQELEPELRPDIDDYIEGSTGNDIIYGYEGNDTIYAGYGNDRIYGGPGSDSIYGQEGDDYIDAGAGDDFIEGGTGGDKISGNDGNDVIFGDRLNTDNVFDVLKYSYHYDLSSVKELPDGSGGQVFKTLEKELSNWTRKDTIQYIRDHYKDLARETTLADSGDNSIESNALYEEDNNYRVSSANAVSGNENEPAVEATVIFEQNLLSAEDDYIKGGDGDDIIYGQEGHDTIYAGAGNDVVDGGTGSDRIYGQEGDDWVDGGDGDDFIYAGAGNDVIDGGSGFDTLVVANETELDFSNISNIERIDLDEDGVGQTITLSLDQVLSMTDEDNTLQITKGDTNDVVELTGCNDGWLWVNEWTFKKYQPDSGEYIFITIEPVDGRVKINLLDGNVIINGEDGDDTIYTGAGDDIIYAEAGNDVVYSGSGSDSIFGKEGNDIIDAGSGDDIVDGGSGFDTLIVTGETELDFSNVSNIESIDLNEDGVDQTITLLTLDQILSMTDGNNMLQITGEAGDFVMLTVDQDAGWDQDGDGLSFNNDGIRVTIESVDVDVGIVYYTDGVIYGSDGVDIIYVDDIIYGLFGSNGNAIINSIESGNGDDIIDAGSGNYIVDGGDGFDTLIVTSETEFDFSNVSNIESIDLNEDGVDQTITLSLDQVVNMTNDANTLQITGEDGDFVTLVSTYTYGSEQDQNEDTLFFYNHGNPVTIELVDVDVGVVTFIDYFIDGSDGDDIIDVDNIIYAIGYNEIDYINGHDGDDIIYGRDSGDDIFGGDGDDIIYGQEGDDNIDAGSGNDIVDGGSGFDTLIVTSETELDFSNINNIESIDLNRDGGDQTITLSLDQVLDMTDEDNTLQITGEAGDSVALTGVESGDWTHEGNGLFTNVADNTILVTIEAADDEVDIDVDVDNGDSFQI
nr:retention module-containing protein [uncultured Desulfobacter sp.]